jgi:uncharacterized membrane protein
VLFKGLVTILACDLIFAIIAIPLILRKVPRNSVYGFRTRSTLENDFVWYKANAYFGRVFFISSFISALLIVFLYFSYLGPVQNFLEASIAVLVAPPMVAVLLTLRYIRSIRSSHR